MNPSYSSVTLGKFLNPSEPQKEGPARHVRGTQECGIWSPGQDSPASLATSVGPPGGLLISPQDCFSSTYPSLAPHVSSKFEGKAQTGRVDQTPQPLGCRAPGGERAPGVSGLRRWHLSSLCDVHSCILKSTHLCDHSLSQHLEGNPTPTPTQGSHALPDEGTEG